MAENQIRERFPAHEKTIAPFLWTLNQPIVYNDLRVVFYTCFLVRHEPGWQCGAHVHDYFESHLVTQGYVDTMLDGRKLHVEPGEFYIIPPGVVHSHSVNADVQDAGVTLRWSMEKIACSDPEAPQVADAAIRSLSRVCDAPLAAEKSHTIFTQPETYYSPPEAQLMLLRWLMDVSARYAHIEDAGCAGARQYLDDKELAMSVMVTINTLHSRAITVEDIARIHGVSYRQLARIFKRATDKTLSQALTAARLSHAMQLLAETDLPIGQISQLVGYPSPYYFANRFSDTYGMSPTQVRKILQGRKIEGGHQA